MRKFLIPPVLVAALVCSPLLFAANPPAASAGTSAKAGQHSARHAGRTMGMLDQLDLTEAQRSSIRQLLQQNFEQARPEMQALRQKQLAFESATPGTANYQTAANELAQAESSAVHARVLRQAALRTKIYEQLTPTQRTKLVDIQAQREAKIKQWRESRARDASAPASSSR